MAEAVDDGRCYEEDKRSRASEVDLISDQVIDPWCDLCYDESRQFVSAKGFCSNCNYFLCIPCTEGHKRYTRTHEILRGERMPRNHAKKPVRYPDCEIHSEHKADQFCLDHSKMVCSECVHEKHNHLCEVSGIGTLSKSISKTHIQQFKDDVASIAKSALAITKSLENNISDIEGQRTGMIENAEDVRETIRDIYLATITDINEICQKKTSDIDAKIKSLAEMKLFLSDTVTDIEKTVQPNLGPNESIRLLELIERTCIYKNEIIELKNSSRVDLSFSFCPRISKLLSNCEKFGDVTETISELTTTEPIEDIKFLKMACEETNVSAKESIELEKMNTLLVNQQDGDTNSLITGMAITKSGVLLIADETNNKIKAFSSNNQLLSSLLLPMDPSKITVIDDKTAAVSGYEQICFLDISDPTRLTILRTSPLNYCQRLIASCAGNLVVVSEHDPPCVKLIDLNAKEQWSTSTFRKPVFLGVKYGQKLLKSPKGIACKTENETTTIVVTDSGKNTITFLDGSNGNVTKVITEKGGIGGVTTDFAGNIYVIMGCEIKVWASNLKTHRTVSSLNTIGGRPDDIIFDNAATELLVSYKTNKVDRFKLCYH